MKIHIIDGPPSLGSPELVRQIALRPTSRNFLCIPHFSKKVDLSKISSQTISAAIQSSIIDLIDRVDAAETAKYSMLFIDGSPITYLAYAKFMNIDISDKVSQKVEVLCSLIYNRTRVSLRLPNSGFNFPNNIKVMSPQDISIFSNHLNDEYESRLRTKVKKIGLR